MTTAETIRAAMERREITQQALADAVGVEQPTVNRWCSGKRSPDLEMIPKVAKVLQIEPYDLLDLNLMSQLGLGPAQPQTKIGAELVDLTSRLRDEDRLVVLDLARSLNARSKRK